MKIMSVLIIVVVAFMITALGTGILIPFLRKAAGQNIREDGPQAHLSKAGTPSMGGIAIVIGILLAGGIGGFFSHHTILMAAGLLIFAGVGFLDDYLKVIKKENEGLKVVPKFTWQLVGSLALAVYIGYFSGIGTSVFIPFYNQYVDFGIFYVPFIVFTMVAMVNAVNLTDGLDGLASGTTAIVSAALMVLAMTVAGANSAAGFLAAVMGACLGFLAFNKHPARIFMGDTGSLALGGAITTAAIIMRMEFFLPIMGLVYVLEALSVVLQVGYFKATGGKRIFKMAPLHHHFELSGFSEWKVVGLFWGFTLLCSLLGLLIAGCFAA